MIRAINIPKIEWEKRIARAEKKNLFAKSDEVAACSWARCAYGQRMKFPDHSRCPDDNTLYDLGKQFYESVQRHEIITTKNLLRIILNYEEKE